MGIYGAIFSLNLKTALRYWKSFILSVLIFPITQLLVIVLMSSLFSNAPNKMIVGYTEAQMIWYFGAIHFFYHLTWSYPDKEMTQYILSGEMTTKLIVPISMLEWEFLKSLAQKSVAFIFEFAPCFFVFTLMANPSFMDLGSFLKYIITTGLAFLMFFLTNFMIGTTAFFWQNTESLQTIKQLIIVVLAGASIPLEFFPASYQEFVLSLPFKYLFYEPLQFLLNMPQKRGMETFLHVVGIQTCWIIALYILARLYWNFAISRFIATGN